MAKKGKGGGSGGNSAPAPAMAARQEARQTARQAASTGSLSQSQIGALRSAGVSSKTIGNIRSANNQAKAANSMKIYQQPNGNPVVTNAPQRPSYIPASHMDAGTQQMFGTRFIPGVMSPGQAGYDPATGGGVWAAGAMSDEDLRAWYRSADPANTGGDVAVAMSGKPASAFTLDGLYGKGVGDAGAAAEAQAKQNLGYKGIGSIRQGLKIGSNNIISKKEANRISRNTGKTFDDVLAKGLSLGFQVSNNAVNRSNKLYAKRGFGMPLTVSWPGSDDMRKQDPLYDMRKIKPTKGKVYSGTYMEDGKYRPLIESRNPQGNPLGIRSRATGPATEATTATTQAEPQSVSTAPTEMTNEELLTPDEQQQQSFGAGSMAGGGVGAAGATKLGRAKSRLRQLGIYGRGTNLLGRGLQYGNALNA